MTRDEACAYLLRFGALEYQGFALDPGVRCFYRRLSADIPDCGQNGEPPSFHIMVFPDIHLRLGGDSYEGGIEFEICGRAGDDRWLRATIYNCKRNELPLLISDAEYTAKRIWTEFSNVMNAIRPRQERSNDEV